MRRWENGCCCVKSQRIVARCMELPTAAAEGVAVPRLQEGPIQRPTAVSAGMEYIKPPFLHSGDDPHS